MKKLLILIMALVLFCSITACDDGKNENNDGDKYETETSQNMDFPKMEELDYSFINGEHYGEPRGVLKLTNNSKYTITQVDFEFSIDQNATDFTAYENLEYTEIDELLGEEEWNENRIKKLTPKVYHYQVCDPGETVEGTVCYLSATEEATNAEQCEIFKLKKANISYLADDKIYTVIYLSENDSYSVQEETEEPFSWSDGAYAKETPVPDTRFLTVDHDEDDYYQFTAYDMTSEQFKEYCNKGKESGFNNDIEEDADSFFGTNANGLRLYVRYLKYMQCIEVQVEIE